MSRLSHDHPDDHEQIVDGWTDSADDREEF